MKVEPSDTPYEIRCNECQVTFPVGTRKCVHCGQRLGRPRIRFAPSHEEGEPWDLGESEEDAADEQMPGRRRLPSPFTLMLLLAAAAASVQRACAG